jgi:hypothetical protein
MDRLHELAAKAAAFADLLDQNRPLFSDAVCEGSSKWLDLSHLEVAWIRNMCSGGLEPGFRVPVSTTFHAIPLEKRQSGRKHWKAVEAKLLHEAATSPLDEPSYIVTVP